MRATGHSALPASSQPPVPASASAAGTAMRSSSCSRSTDSSTPSGEDAQTLVRRTQPDARPHLVALPHTLQTVGREQWPYRDFVADAGEHPAVRRQQLGGRLAPRKTGKGGAARRLELAVSGTVQRQEDLGGPGIQE